VKVVIIGVGERVANRLQFAIENQTTNNNQYTNKHKLLVAYSLLPLTTLHNATKAKNLFRVSQ